jgi:hypothetical protein
MIDKGASAQSIKGRPSASLLSPDIVKYFVPALYAFVVVWLAAWFVYGFWYWEDDAFIHLEFARSVAEGRGFAFNGLETYGDTSPLWVLLLAAAHALIPAWIPAGKTLMALSGFAALAATRSIALKLAPEGVAPQLFAAVLVALVALNPYFVYWLLSGMEAPLAIAVSLWIISAAAIGPANWTSFWIGCALAGLSPLLRPELALLVLIVAPFFLLRALRLTADKPIGTRLAVLALAAVLGAGPLIAWLAYAHHAFGTMISNTNAAKAEFGKNSVLQRLATVFGFGAPLIPIFAVVYPLYAIFALARPRGGFGALAGRLRAVPAAIWIVAAWSILTCAFYIVNRTYVQTRYVLVFTPALLILIFFVIGGLGRRRMTYAAVLFTALSAAAVSLLVARPFVANKMEAIRKTSELVAFMKTLPPDQPVAVYAIGQVAFESRHPIIDTGGITRPSVIPFMNEPQRVIAWTKQEGARYIVQDVAPEAGAKLVYDSTKPFAAWTLDLRQFSKNQPLRIWALAPAGADAPMP